MQRFNGLLITIVRRIGNSLGILLPKSVLEAWGAMKGTTSRFLSTECARHSSLDQPSRSSMNENDDSPWPLFESLRQASSGDRGDPMKYFRYREHPYWPEEDWYHVRQIWDSGSERTYTVGGLNYNWRFQRVRQENFWKPVELVPIDWNRVACQYDYLLVTLPMNPTLIGVPTQVVRENGAAALLAVDRSVCRPAMLGPNAVHLRSEH